ncbi:MAG: kynureninase [Sediminibacterium sp.]|nr:kynureninase [Sediminibacterium sp.]
MLLNFETGIDFAQKADAADPLKHFKEWFYFPQHNGSNAIYFCGNSLGLQPIHVEKAIRTELDTWREKAVGGYFGGTNPWLFYQDYVGASLANLVGASTEEITVMNGLTVNLHLMLLSFYHPTENRYKIIMEAGAFPSDQYAIETIARHYGRQPEEVIVEVAPRSGEKTLRTEDILNTIDRHRNELALVLFGGINYYTGQFFDLAAITQKAHEAGALAGFDLAHVTGNIPLQLHGWNVDFAVWCSYKYLNAGPGAVGGVFIHAQHAANINTPRLGGWWGNEEKERFKMEKGFVPKANAGGWNLSTAQVFNTVALKASLELFDQAGITAIRKKSIALTAYLEFLLKQLTNISFEIITPEDPGQRGAQLSLFFTSQGKAIHNKMMDSGIIVDYREPGVIRVAPAPLYCSFEDVYRFYEILKNNF